MFRRHQHLFFMTIVCSVIALAAYVFFSSRIISDAAGSGTYVEVYDQYIDGVHHVSGTVPVSSSCTDVYTYAEARIDTMILSFVPKPTTADGSVCTRDMIRLPFETSVETDETISYYLAEVGGTIYPVRVLGK